MIIQDSGYGKGTYEKAVFSIAAKALRTIPQYNYYRFTVLNNMFASRGFFIHPDNREEEYIKIIETGDEELVNKLEEFLNIMTQLETYREIHNSFIEAMDKLGNTTDEEEMQRIVDDLYEMYGTIYKAG